MPVFIFGEWLPDVPAIVNPGVIEARNVLPASQGYVPIREFTVATTALDDRPLSAITGYNTSGNQFQYAGDPTKLYENVDNVWTDVSKLGGYTTDGDTSTWEFEQWRNKILATNYKDNPQHITFGDPAFADLTSELRARHLAVVNEFVVFGDTFDSTDGDVPYRVRWSAFGNELDYVVSPSTLADYQDLKVSRVVRIIGGEYGVVFQKDRIWRMTWVGAPKVFQFDEVLLGIGLISPRAAVRVGDTIYFWSYQGFFSLDNGSRVNALGAGRLDKFVLDDLDLSYVHRISAVRDPSSHKVFFSYPGAGSSGGNPNRLVVIDPSLNKWSIIDQDALLLWASAGTNITLDAAASEGDPDTLDGVGGDVSFDDARWVGGIPDVAAFDHARKSGFFDGHVREGTIITREFAFAEGRRSRLNGFRGLFEGGDVMAQVGSRNSLADPVVFGTSLTSRSEGRFAVRSNARYHRFKFTVGGDWTRAIGMEISGGDLVAGERRG